MNLRRRHRLNYCHCHGARGGTSLVILYDSRCETKREQETCGSFMHVMLSCLFVGAGIFPASSSRNLFVCLTKVTLYTVPFRERGGQRQVRFSVPRESVISSNTTSTAVLYTLLRANQVVDNSNQFFKSHSLYFPYYNVNPQILSCTRYYVFCYNLFELRVVQYHPRDNEKNRFRRNLSDTSTFAKINRNRRK